MFATNYLLEWRKLATYTVPTRLAFAYVTGRQ